MFKIDRAAFARWRNDAARVCVVSAPAMSAISDDHISDDHMADDHIARDHMIDYAVLVRWCAEAARVVSWR